MENKNYSNILKTLEYEKIKYMLAQEASSLLGKELADTLCPAQTYEVAKVLLCQTEEAYNILRFSSPPIGGIYDIRNNIKKATVGETLCAEDFSNILSTIIAIKKLQLFFEELGDEFFLLKEIASELTTLGNLEQILENTFNENNAIKDDATPELSKIRKSIRSSHMTIKKVMTKILHSEEYKKYFQDLIITTRNNRYVIPIKQEFRNSFPGIVHDQSSTGATLFVEPVAIINLNNDIKQLYLSEKKEIERIYFFLSQIVKKNADILYKNLSIASNIDFIFARAKLAVKQKANLPLLNNLNNTNLCEARHPLIDAEKIVPINIAVGKNYSMLLITGPNTGGKTVSMKTLGLLALMAKSGLYITASPESEIAFYSNIFADIGDEQSIEQNLSTFSSHMTFIIKILSMAEKNDLILLDEIGAGTAPEEGAALAFSILEEFLNKKISVVATTHYSQLKTFAYIHKNVQNACMEFDINTLKPTFHLLTGIPGSSNALAISTRLGLPLCIINRAKSLIQTNYVQIEEVISKLENEKIIYEQLNRSIHEKQKKLTSLESELQKTKNDLQNRKDSILRKAKEESHSLIRNTKHECEEIIKEIKKQYEDYGIKKRQKAISDVRLKLQNISNNTMESDFSNSEYSIPVNPNSISAGDTVFIQGINQKATVLEIHNQELLLEIGNMKMNLPANRCFYIGKVTSINIPDKKHTSFSLQKTKTIHREIDIRGLMIDEGEIIVSKFIDDALLAGLKQIVIIHGKGTGALRSGIQAFLKFHPNVRAYNLADIADGGSGATIVNLK